MTSQKQITIDQQRQLARLITAASLLIVLGSLFLWYSFVFTNPNRVFWNMVDASLKSYGRTTYQSQSDPSRNLSQDQKLQLQLGAQNVAQGQTTLKQGIGNNLSIAVTTSSISTPNANYVRYEDITIAGEGGAQPGFKELANVWAKDETGAANNSVFLEGMFGSLGFVPNGNLNYEQRQELVKFMQENEVYKIDASKVKKESRNMRPVQVYEVTVNAEKYVEMLKKFDAFSGLNRLQSVDPSQFAGGEPVVMSVTVDVLSRNMVEATYAGSAQKVNFADYGATIPVQEPTETVDLKQLQEKLQVILSSLQAQ